MNERYRLFRRGNGVYFIEDRHSRRQESLRTKDKDTARRVAHARNESHREPALNLQMAKAYLAASDPTFVRRVWREVIVDLIETIHGSNQARAHRAFADLAFDLIRDLQLLETRAEHFLKVLKAGRVSTNSYLRRLHNFAMGMGWLPWPVLPKNRWPAIRYGEKRAITKEEHELILSRETNQEMRAFLWCCWHIGGSQSDVAHLKGQDVDWAHRVVSFFRAKTGTVQLVQLGSALAEVLAALPKSGPLFPRLGAMDEKHRASLFQRCCRRVKISGISLHSYRYAWAERARVAGMPERFAQEALGHNSKAVHRAYAKKAQVKVPSLDDYEKAMDDRKVIGVTFEHDSAAASSPNSEPFNSHQ